MQIKTLIGLLALVGVFTLPVTAFAVDDPEIIGQIVVGSNAHQWTVGYDASYSSEYVGAAASSMCSRSPDHGGDCSSYDDSRVLGDDRWPIRYICDGHTESPFYYGIGTGAPTSFGDPGSCGEVPPPPPFVDSSATSTVNQVQSNLAFGFFLFFISFAFWPWLFVKRR